MSYNKSRMCKCGHRHFPGPCGHRACGCDELRPEADGTEVEISEDAA